MKEPSLEWTLLVEGLGVGGRVSLSFMDFLGRWGGLGGGILRERREGIEEEDEDFVDLFELRVGEVEEERLLVVGWGIVVMVVGGGVVAGDAVVGLDLGGVTGNGGADLEIGEVGGEGSGVAGTGGGTISGGLKFEGEQVKMLIWNFLRLKLMSSILLTPIMSKISLRVALYLTTSLPRSLILFLSKPRAVEQTGLGHFM